LSFFGLINIRSAVPLRGPAYGGSAAVYIPEVETAYHVSRNEHGND